MGASAAYHLATAGAGAIVVSVGGSPGRGFDRGGAAGGFRYQFSSEVNVRLSQANVPMITGFTEEHGLPLDVAEDGCLFLVRNGGLWNGFVAANDLHRSLGIEAEILTPEEAVARAPGISTWGPFGVRTASRIRRG